MSNTKRIPELRFPEFKNDGEWEFKSLDEICKLVRGPFGGALKKEIFVKEGYAVYEQSHAIYSDFDSFRYRINEDKFQELKRFSVKAGDLIMSCSGTMGKFATIPNEFEQGVINQALLKITARKGYDNSFVKISLETDTNQRKLLSQSAGGAIKNVVSVSQIRELELAVPKSEEQQKIASCLSSLDELIAAHRDKLGALKDHKKGLMQNLFPQEGQKVPNYRFPEFKNDGEWEIRSIENNIDLISGIALKSKDLSDDVSGIPILRGINITEGRIRHSEDMDKFFLGPTFDIEKYLIEENDIVIGMDGSKVGKNVALVSKEDAGSILIQRVARIKAIDSSVNYLYQHFVSSAFRRYVDVVNTSSGIPHISAKQIRDFEIGFPPKLKEQERIASCLSSLDNLISAQVDLIKELDQHKKGLMQGLFPKIEN